MQGGGFGRMFMRESKPKGLPCMIPAKPHWLKTHWCVNDLHSWDTGNLFPGISGLIFSCVLVSFCGYTSSDKNKFP